MTTSLAQPLPASRSKDETQSSQYILQQAATSSVIHETMPVAFTLLFDLLNTPELASNPLLHATTHTLVALNMPLHTRTEGAKTSLKDPSGELWKSVYLTKAEDILFDLKRERHENGQCETCQQYAVSSDLDDVRREILRTDGCECNSVIRLERVLEKERQMVNEEISREWHRDMENERNSQSTG